MTTTEAKQLTAAEALANPELAPIARDNDGVRITGPTQLYFVKADAERHAGRNLIPACIEPGTIFRWDGTTLDSEGDIVLQFDDGSTRWLTPDFAELVAVEQPATATQVEITYAALAESSDLKTYRVKADPRRTGTEGSTDEDTPAAGTVFTWDGTTTDDDGDITIKPWRGQSRVGHTSWIKPRYAELVEDEPVYPADDQGSTIMGAADYVNGLSEQVAVDEAATTNGLTEAQAEIMRLRNLLDQRNGNVEEYRQQRDIATRQAVAAEHKLEALAQALVEEADNRSWCSEYEEFVDSHPDLGLIKRVQNYRVTMTLSVEVDVPVDGVKSEDEARHVARNRDLAEIIYGLDRWDISAQITSVDSVEEVDD